MAESPGPLRCQDRVTPDGAGIVKENPSPSAERGVELAAANGPMALHSVEEATLRAFLVPSKRDRFVTLLGNAAHRKKILNGLNHFDGWDPRYAQAMKSPKDVL